MRYFANTSWLFAEKVLRIVVGIFVGIWVARYLEPEQFGLFSYAQSFVGLFATIATFGLDGIVVRELVKGKVPSEVLIGTTFWLKIIGAVFVLGILVIAVLFTANNEFTNLLIFIIAGSTVFQAFNVVDFYFQAKVLSRYVVFANVISLLISSLVKIVLIVYEAPLIAFAWSVLFDSIILALGFIYYFLNKADFGIRQWGFHKATAFILLKDSWPLILSGVVISLYMRIDQIMIMNMLGSEAVGQYAAAVRLSEAWYFIPMVIASSLFPAIINAKEKSETLYYIRLQKLYDLMVWMAIAIALPMTFLSDWIVNFLYGKEYTQASSVLMIHIWAGVFVFLGVAFSKYLVAENLSYKAFYRTLFGASLNIFFNYLLIPIYGINGAAIATFLGQFIANYVYDFFDNDLHHQLKMKSMCFFPIHIFKK